MSIIIKKATLNDLEWINELYEYINLKQSTLKDEVVVFAEADNNKIGLGRIQKIQDNIAEVGGIYVTPTLRDKKVARRIVCKLLNLGQEYNTIYCLPF